MPIDPRIPLMGQGPPARDPFALPAQILQLQAVREQVEARRRDAEQTRRAQQQQQQLGEAYRQAATLDPDTGEVHIDRGALLQRLPPALWPAVLKELDEDDTRATSIQEAQARLDELHRKQRGSIAMTVRAANYDPGLWKVKLGELRRLRALTPDAHAYLAQLPADQIQPLIDDFIAQSRPEVPLQKVTTVNAQGQAVEQFVRPTEGAQYVQPPPKPGTVTLGEWPDYLARWARENHRDPNTLTTADIDQAREKFRLDQRPSVTVQTGGDVDPNAIADAIIAGDQPPTLQGLYRYGAPVRAALAKRGYDLSSAQIDWSAAQRHFATLNNPQQTRLRQAVDTAIHSLDVIDTLATQWKGGPLPALNRVSLAAAKNGLYGPQWATVAQQLEGQIADVTSEIANALMGGNSPTDHALKLAATNLSSNWSEKTLKDMTALARKNLQIRQNAIRNVGVIGASEVNPYVPQPAPPPAEPSGVPANVAAALGRVGPGRHTLSDGSVWEKRADGAIVKVK